MFKSKTNLIFFTSFFLFVAALGVLVWVDFQTGRGWFAYFGRLCSHMYDGGRRLILTLARAAASPFSVALIAFLVLGFLVALINFFRRVVLSERLNRKIKRQKGSKFGRLTALRLPPLLLEKIEVIPAKEPLVFCSGFWQPKIKLSFTLLRKLKESELLAVLYHEEHHLKNLSNLRILISRFFSDLLFFLPIFGTISNYLEKNKEFEADDYAIQKLGQKVYLASALYQLLAFGSVEGGYSFSSAYSFVNERIDRLLGKKNQEGGQVRQVFLCLSVVLFLVLPFLVRPVAADSSSNEDMIMPIRDDNRPCALRDLKNTNLCHTEKDQSSCLVNQVKLPS